LQLITATGPGSFSLVQRRLTGLRLQPSAAVARLLAFQCHPLASLCTKRRLNGSVNPGFTFRAWDQTTGTNGNTADCSANGGPTAFSTATETAKHHGQRWRHAAIQLGTYTFPRCGTQPLPSPESGCTAGTGLSGSSDDYRRHSHGWPSGLHGS
jgi:hypothetical protein